MSNATDIEERVRAGFAALLDELRAGLDEAPKKTIRANTEAREREQNRVWREYADIGELPPSDMALSITARVELGYLVVIDQPTYEAAE